MKRKFGGLGLRRGLVLAAALGLLQHAGRIDSQSDADDGCCEETSEQDVDNGRSPVVGHVTVHLRVADTIRVDSTRTS